MKMIARLAAGVVAAAVLFPAPASAGEVSRDPKRACGAAGSGLGVALVILTREKSIPKAKYDKLANFADGVLRAAERIVRAAGNRVPKSASGPLLRKHDPEKFVAWCRTYYPNRYNSAFKAGTQFAKSEL